MAINKAWHTLQMLQELRKEEKLVGWGQARWLFWKKRTWSGNLNRVGLVKKMRKGIYGSRKGMANSRVSEGPVK